MLADEFNPALMHHDTLQRELLAGIRADTPAPRGWGAALERELTRTVPTLDENGTVVGSELAPGIGNLSLELLDSATLQLTLPSDVDYSIEQPETIRATLPASSLLSNATAIEVSPPLRIEAAGGRCA